MFEAFGWTSFQLLGKCRFWGTQRVFFGGGGLIGGGRGIPPDQADDSVAPVMHAHTM